MANTAAKQPPQDNEPRADKAKAEPARPAGTDAGADQVQERIDAEQEQGFRGIEVDPTPNENYTVAGVTAGAPTPETDPAAAEEARKAQADVASKATGVAER